MMLTHFLLLPAVCYISSMLSVLYPFNGLHHASIISRLSMSPNAKI